MNMPLNVKRTLLEYFKTTIKREHQDYPLHEYEINALAENEYRIRFNGISENPDQDDSSPCQRNQEAEKQAWVVVSAIMEVSPEEIQQVVTTAVNDDLRSRMMRNRMAIQTGDEYSSHETDNSLLSIILDNRATISDLANTRGTDGEREFQSLNLIRLLTGSEEVQKTVNEYNQSHPLSDKETQNEATELSALSQIGGMNTAEEHHQMQDASEKEIEQQGIASQKIEPQRQPAQNATKSIDPEVFIRDLQVSYLDNTEVKIQYKGKRKNCNCELMGFRDSTTQEWRTFLEILEDKKHNGNVYKLGPAHVYNETTGEKERIKDYDKKRHLINEISEKLKHFLAQQYPVCFPPKFKLYEPQLGKGPGVYSFKFRIPSNKPSYKTKAQALKRLGVLVRNGVTQDQFQQAYLIAIEEGATPEEISKITQNRAMVPLQQDYSEATEDPDEDNDVDELA